ncbi:MAG: DedA family protein [Patescibacteria group bacterium]
MSFDTIVQLFTHYGYSIVFPISIVEGPTISTISGFFVSLKIFNPYVVFSLLVLGDAVGDTIYYLLGRYGGAWFLNKIGRHIGATPERIAFLEENFHKHDWKILLFGKTQAIGSAILFVAGAVKIKFGRFIFFNILGTIPKTILFMTIGFYFGKTYSTSSKYIDYFSLVWLLLSVLLIGGYYYVKKRIKKSTFNTDHK